MHEIEPSSFCSYDEYEKFLKNRIEAGDLSIGGLYLVLADIRQKNSDKKAFKFPVRVKSVSLLEYSFGGVTISLLDADLQPVEDSSVTVKNGLISKPGIMESSTCQTVHEMYIRDYDGYFDPDNLKITVDEEVDDRNILLV